MSMWLQHLLVIVLVAACVAVVGRQLVQTFRLGKGGLGKCCSRGCDAETGATNAKRVVFVPSESLLKRR